jgi:hypothetical protein
VYGIQLQPKNDRYIEIAHLALAGAVEAAVPGAFLVNMFPLRESYFDGAHSLLIVLPVKHVPEWMPGAGFKSRARRWRASTLEMVSAPFMAVKKNLVSILPM